MKTRIISGAAALALLAAVMFLGREALGVAIFAAALLCVYEFYNAVGHAGYKPMKVVGYISCLPLLYLGVFGSNWGDFPRGTVLKISALSVFLILLALLAVIVFLYGKINLVDISITLFGILYVVFLLSFVIQVRNLENGHLYIWMVFIGAWATDTSAYFAGVTMGRRKILPNVSPKKTLEGSIGGVIGCMAVMLAFGAFVNTQTDAIPLVHFAVIGLICGLVSQIGDWAASAVKRFVNIKDFGNIMPGHGGLLDRCDSILVVAPAVYFYIALVL